MQKDEVVIEINYLRRFNLGNYQHKEYAVRLGGTQTQIEEGFAERKAKVQSLIEQIENMVDEAHNANLLKAQLEKKITAS